MNKQFFSLLLLLLPFASFSQVGVGTNNVDPSAKFQIETNNKGFLQPRIALTSTTDVVTIANPATGLMVFNTATAGSGATAITPGVHYFDGTRWVRMQASVINAGTGTTVTGSGTTASPYVINSTSGSSSSPAVFVAGEFLNPQTNNRTITTDNGDYRSPALKLASITLPPGKWEVNMAISCEVQSWNVFQPNFNNYTSNNRVSTDASTTPTGFPIKMMYWLQDVVTIADMRTSGYDVNAIQIFSGGTISVESVTNLGDTLFRNSAKLVQAIQNSTPDHAGVFFINNTSGADKTYYLFAYEQTNIGNAGLTNVLRMPQYAQEFAVGWYTFNRFYAKKIE